MQQHEKTSLRYVFFRLYSNDELLDFLKEQLKNGLVLDHCKGNFFFFSPLAASKRAALRDLDSMQQAAGRG